MKNKTLFFRNLFVSYEGKEDNDWFHQATLYLASSFKKQELPFAICNSKFSLKNHEILASMEELDEILEKNPDINMIVITLLEDCFDKMKQLSEYLTKKTSAYIAVGGIMPTLNPEHVLIHLPQINIIVRGEGEKILPKIQEILSGTDTNSSLTESQKKEIKKLKGVIFRNKKETIHSDDFSINLVENLDELNLDFSLLNKENITDGLNLSTSRGCYNNCFFCIMPTKGVYRAKSVENLKKVLGDYEKRLIEIYGKEELIPPSARKLSFNDDDFLGSRKRATEFFRFIKTTNFKINFIQTAINSFFKQKNGQVTDEFDTELIESMHKDIFFNTQDEGHNIHSICIGTENFCDEELKRLGKPHNFEKIEKVIKALSRQGIRQAHHLILTNIETTLDNLFENFIKIAILKMSYYECFDILLPVIPNLVSLYPSASYKIIQKKGGLENLEKKWLKSKNYPNMDYPLIKKDNPMDVDVRNIAEKNDKFIKGQKYYESFFEKTMGYLLNTVEDLRIKNVETERIKKLDCIIKKYHNYVEIIKQGLPEEKKILIFNNRLSMIEKIEEIEDICNFLISDKIFFPESCSDKKDVMMLYRGAYNALRNKKNRMPLIQKKLTAIDNLLMRLIYTKELIILNEGDTKISNNYSHLIEQFIDYPQLISKNNKIDLRNVSEGVDRLVVLVTHSCQLNCEYCNVRKFNAEMDLSILKKAINLLFTSKKDELQLQFFGGEPLLRFGLVKKGAAYAEQLSNKTGKKIKFLLTTNGIALTSEKIDYLVKHNFTIEFSLDGDKETQLKSRKSVSGINYYNTVIRNLSNLVQKNADYYTISVVTPQNVQNLYKNFKYLINTGFTNLQINYVLGKFWGKKKTKILLEQVSKIAAFIRKSPRNINLINSLKNRKEPVVLNAEITVDCDGTIYLETGISLEEDFNKLKNDFKIGDINTIKDIDCIFATRSRNFKKLVDVYSQEKEQFRKTILNNIEVGIKMRKLLKNNLSPIKKIKSESEPHPQEVKEKINYLRFMVYKLLSDDLYPPVSLGRKLTEKEVIEGWKKTSDMINLGKAPKKLGIYVHIPYCVTKCKFCFCGSIMLPKNSKEIDDYLGFLEAQINKFSKVLKNNAITSLYVGGGTPSILNNKQLIRFFDTIYKNFNFEKNSAIIFESTPLTLTREKARILRDFGKVTRITVGIQSLNKKVLKNIERLQTDTLAKNAIRYAKEFIPFVNCDYVVSLPGQTKKMIKADLIKLTGYAPDSIHLNSFKPLFHTLLVEQAQINIENKKGLKEETFIFAEKILHGQGYVNRDGSYTRFDIKPVDNAQELDLRRQNSSLLGLGYLATSHSYGGHRYVYYPLKPNGNMNRIKNLDKTDFFYFGIENNSDEEMRRFMISSIRCNVSIKKFIKLFGTNPRIYFNKEFTFLKKAKKLDINNDIISFNIGSDKDGQVLSKLFFSKKLMATFNKKYASEYDENFDYNNILKNYILDCD